MKCDISESPIASTVQGSVPVPCAKLNIVSRPQPPENWSGPFVMTYLSRCAKDPETGRSIIMTIKNFDEAITKANELGDGCSGITQTERGYSLRIGQLTPTPNEHREHGIASWIKSLEVTPSSSIQLPTYGFPRVRFL